MSLTVFLGACSNNTPQNNTNGAITGKDGNKHYCDGELEVINDAGDTRCDGNDGRSTFMSGGVFFANFSSYDSAQKSKASGKSGTYTAPKTSSTDTSTNKSDTNKVETDKSDTKVKSNKSSSSSGKSSGFSSGRSGGGSS